MEKDFLEIVYSSWNSQLLDSMDPMTSLTFKLKRLKAFVRVWEKELKQTKAKALLELDRDINSLLTSQAFGILYAFESSQLSSLKDKKDSLLTQQILT